MKRTPWNVIGPMPFPWSGHTARRAWRLAFLPPWPLFGRRHLPKSPCRRLVPPGSFAAGLNRVCVPRSILFAVGVFNRQLNQQFRISNKTYDNFVHCRVASLSTVMSDFGSSWIALARGIGRLILFTNILVSPLGTSPSSRGLLLGASPRPSSGAPPPLRLPLRRPFTSQATLRLPPLGKKRVSRSRNIFLILTPVQRQHHNTP